MSEFDAVPGAHDATVSHVATAAALASPAPAAQDVTENVRAFVEKGVGEGRARYAQVKSTAQEATSALEASVGAARSGAVAFQVRTLQALRAGAQANFELLRSLADARSPADLATLHAAYARDSIERATAQAQAFADLARETAAHAAAPLQAQARKLWSLAG